MLAAFERLPQIVDARRARRATRDGRHGGGRAGRAPPARAPDRFGTELVAADRARGATSRRSGRCPTRRTRRRCTPRSASRGARPSSARQPFRGEPPALVELADVRGDLHSHTTWSDGRATVLRDGPRRPRPRLRVPRDLRPHGERPRRPRARRRRGAPAGARRSPQRTSELAPFRVLRGIEVDIRRDGALDLPDDVLAELDWVQLSLHAGQREARGELDDEGRRRRCGTRRCAA